MTRAVLFVLIPLSLVVTMIDVQQGSPQNFNKYETVQLLEPVGVTADGSIVSADDPAAVETIDQATVPMGPCQPGRHQAAGHERRRLQRRELRKRAREPPRPHQPGAMPVAAAHPVACVFSFGRFVMDRRQGRAPCSRPCSSCW